MWPSTSCLGKQWNIQPWRYSKLDWVGPRELFPNFEVSPALTRDLNEMTSFGHFQSELVIQSTLMLGIDKKISIEKRRKQSTNI